MMKQSMYCDFPCALGLVAYAEMAEAAGKTDDAHRWREVARRLTDSMEAYYPTQIQPWGDVWNPDKNADFIYRHSTLAPAVIGMDYWGYDVMHKLPAAWAERTRRTYHMQLSQNQPRAAATAGIGYGQCYITQAALLMDQMADAAEMLEWLARVCYAPRQPHPYRVPEGAIISADGNIWRRWGDLGNLYQLNEVLYTVHLMVGIDDLHREELLLMPRLPFGWTKMEVDNWPVRCNSAGTSSLLDLSYHLTRDKMGNAFSLRIKTSKPIDAMKVRVGPFPKDTKGLRALCNDKGLETKLEPHGNAKWAWIELGPSASTMVTLNCEALNSVGKEERR